MKILKTATLRALALATPGTSLGTKRLRSLATLADRDEYDRGVGSPEKRVLASWDVKLSLSQEKKKEKKVEFRLF